MMCTRPDIYHAVGGVSRFLSNPGKLHPKPRTRSFEFSPLPIQKKGSSDLFHLLNNTLRQNKERRPIHLNRKKKEIYQPTGAYRHRRELCKSSSWSWFWRLFFPPKHCNLPSLILSKKRGDKTVGTCLQDPEYLQERWRSKGLSLYSHSGLEILFAKEGRELYWFGVSAKRMSQLRKRMHRLRYGVEAYD